MRDLDKTLALRSDAHPDATADVPARSLGCAQMFGGNSGNYRPNVIHGHGAKGGVYARLVGAMPGEMRRRRGFTRRTAGAFTTIRPA